MNRTIRDVLLFGAGFAAGAYIMHTVFRTKYQEYADAQIDDVRDHYRKKEADLDIPSYLVNISYVAPDIIEQKRRDARLANLEIY